MSLEIMCIPPLFASDYVETLLTALFLPHNANFKPWQFQASGGPFLSARNEKAACVRQVYLVETVRNDFDHHPRL
jgi:hypothetical protein